MSLEDLADRVDSRESLVDFLQSLRADLQQHPQQWENATLARYLEAMQAWIEDMDGYYQNAARPLPEHPSWSMLADILRAASVYE